MHNTYRLYQTLVRERDRERERERERERTLLATISYYHVQCENNQQYSTLDVPARLHRRRDIMPIYSWPPLKIKKQK